MEGLTGQVARWIALAYLSSEKPVDLAQPHFAGEPTHRRAIQAARMAVVDVLDGLVHAAHQIQLKGESMRKKRADLTKEEPSDK